MSYRTKSHISHASCGLCAAFSSFNSSIMPPSRQPVTCGLTPSGCIFISLLELPPSLDLSCTSIVFLPARAALRAAAIPASPPPATRTSHFKSALRMSFSPSAEPGSESGRRLASLRELSSVGSGRARTCGAFIIAEYPKSDAADAARNPRRPILFFPFSVPMVRMIKNTNRERASPCKAKSARRKIFKKTSCNPMNGV